MDILLGVIFIGFCGLKLLIIAIWCFFVSVLIAKYFTKILGGLTGDTYGALTETGNALYLLLAYYILR